MKLRIMAAVSGVLLLALALIGLYRMEQASPPEAASLEGAASLGAPDAEMSPHSYTSSSRALPMVAGDSNSPPVAPANWRRRLLTEDGKATQLTREVIDRWLASGRTNAADLLAARRAGGIAFLHSALTNFPNDPRVLFAATALDDGPGSRRERLDRFKAAAPDNALADYLSARDHFSSGRPEQAVADLLAASGKTHFNDYTLDAMQNAEDLYLQSGKTPAEAKALGTSTTRLPHLAQLKGLAEDMAALQRQYLAVGDAASAENLARIGIQLGEQLNVGEGSNFSINRLVGISVERIVLEQLDPDRNYEFLHGSVRDFRGQLDTRHASVKQGTEFLNQWLVNATDVDLISYFDRIKIYGESEAVAWARQRQGIR